MHQLARLLALVLSKISEALDKYEFSTAEKTGPTNQDFLFQHKSFIICRYVRQLIDRAKQLKNQLVNQQLTTGTPNQFCNEGLTT